MRAIAGAAVADWEVATPTNPAVDTSAMDKASAIFLDIDRSFVTIVDKRRK